MTDYPFAYNEFVDSIRTTVEVYLLVVCCLVVLTFVFWGATVGSVVGLVFSVAA